MEHSIIVRGLSKQYRLGEVRRNSYKTLRDQLAKAIAAPIERARGARSALPSKAHEHGSYFWALDDVSFDICEGEVVGVIGRNGAGKTTLLKLLSRITEPTRGTIDMYGRVGSLLEVGTGFHKELTGRENVYLNGAILGMSKSQIDDKFDEIVAFAEVEKFIDTPVKFYSSGMGVRLAFSVAAYLEPEILLVDEVLAVGDTAFQKKCLSKMEDVGQQGRTVIFISHHMPSIARLCSRSFLLEKGKIIMDGPTAEVIGSYLKHAIGSSSHREWEDIEHAPGNEIVRLRSLRALTVDGQSNGSIDVRKSIGVELTFEVLKEGYSLYPGFTVHNDEGLWLFASLDTDEKWRGKIRPRGIYTSTGWIPGNFLAEGTMIVGASIRTEEPRILHFYEQEAIAFQVIESPDGDSARVDYAGKFPGVVRPMLDWETKFHAG